MSINTNSVRTVRSNLLTGFRASNAFLASIALQHIECASEERRLGTELSLNRARVHINHARRIISKLEARGVKL